MMTKPPPMRQQIEAVEAAGTRTAFAFLMEQGTGKSRCCIDRSELLYNAGLINALLVLAPNGVHRNWIEREVPLHCAVPFRSFTWTSGLNKTQTRELEEFLDPTRFVGELRVLAVNVEAMSHDNAPRLVRKFLTRFNTHFVFDESSTGKTPSAKRTKKIINLGSYAKFRSIASGTDITEGPLDTYAQFKFLQPGALCELHTFAEFKAFFAEYEDRILDRVGPNGEKTTYKALIKYKNLHLLKRDIDSMSYRVLKKDCLDIPPKVFIRRPVEMAPAQKSLYKEVLKNVVTWLRDNETISVTHKLTRLLRLSQIAGGWYQADESREPERIVEKVAKIESLKTLIEDTPGKFIIWARFRHELDAIDEALREYTPVASALWWGDIPMREREEGKQRFIHDPDCRFLIANAKSAGYGHDFTVANFVVYYSNEWGLEPRLQSEDRPHRIGQKNPCTYWDLLSGGTIDHKQLNALTAKRELKDLFSGDTETLIRWMNEQ